MKVLLQDLRYAFRVLKKSPGFTIVAVLTLALGIGANAAIFSVVNAVLINPLPFPESNRLLALWEDASSIGFPKNNASVANYFDWKNRNTTFEDIAEYSISEFNLTGIEEPIKLLAARTTANLFSVLRVKPLLGRAYTSEEDRPEGDKVVVLTYGLWQSAFAGDPAILGRSITLSGDKHTVIGIMPRGFGFPDAKVDLWTPSRFGPRQMQNRGAHYLTVVGRMKPGVSLEQARTDIATIMGQLQQEYPEANKLLGSVVIPLRDDYVGDVRPAFAALLAGVVCLLLITCANVANLLLVRATGRSSEIAVRAALGASRSRLVRQMLVEGLLLSAAGGMVGVITGWWTFDFVSNLIPQRMSGWVEMSIDWRVMAFCALISIGAGLVFGLVPMFTAARFDLARVLQQGGNRSGNESGNRTRNVLVVCEVALSVVLLIGAGLLIRSFDKLRRVDLGFRPEGVLTANTDLPESQYKDYAPRMHFYNSVLDRVRALPGVRAAGYVTAVPLDWKGGTNSFTIEGRPPLPVGQYNDANSRIVTSGYFEAIGTPLQRGRLFDDSDMLGKPLVVVINSSMAEQFWPGEDALGKRFKLDGDGPWFTIVGIVGAARQMGLGINGRAEFYRANQQVDEFAWNRPSALVVRTEGDPLRFAPGVRQIVKSIDRDQPVASIQSMSSIVEREIQPLRVQIILLGTFAALAVGLASLGIYGVLSYAVSQRTREIGLRMALGAQREQVLSMVMSRALRLLLTGLALGLTGGWMVSRVMASLLFEVNSNDPLTFGGATLVLAIVALLAAFLPARRAARVDPLVALRYE